LRIFVGVTDNDWFDYLAGLQPEEVNFWRPSGKGFSTLEPGAPFLFKLHSPLNYIVGGGFFVRAEKLPLSLAWEAFGQKNGARDKDALEKLIRQHRGGAEADPGIGCIILNQPFFIPRDRWLPAPADWSRNIVTGKIYDDTEPIGRRIWDMVRPWLPRFQPVEPSDNMVAGVSETARLYGSDYLTRSRLGQGAFRILVTGAYARRCAVSGERTLPVLQASHIKPYGKGPNQVSNGLLLRSDLHILFDRGYVTVTPDYQVEVSRRIKAEYENGRDYYRFHGNPLVVLPHSATDRPHPEYLKWHNEKIFLG
jgi:putative restriction endonuclease